MGLGDVFPRRNLPNEAEEWGRAMEDKVERVESAVPSEKDKAVSHNRTLAAQIPLLYNRTQELVDYASEHQQTYTHTQTVTAPGSEAYTPGVSVSGPSWATEVFVTNLAVAATQGTLTGKMFFWVHLNTVNQFHLSSLSDNYPLVHEILGLGELNEGGLRPPTALYSPISAHLSLSSPVFYHALKLSPDSPTPAGDVDLTIQMSLLWK